MKYIFIFLIFFFFQNCSTKPKTVLICGDHLCVNKAEAEQYFEENLTIEVKIINKLEKNKIDLVELNLKDSAVEKKKISIVQKNTTEKKIKTLSNKDIKMIKKKVSEKKKRKLLTKRDILIDERKNKKIIKNNKNLNKRKITLKDKSLSNKKINVNKMNNKIVDVCTIVKKCSIEEISKYLLEQGKNNDFPDITTRE